MKLKGLTKLVLAGTALAATAATLTTSTYAWYVTNNKVEATGVSGATAGENVAGSLLIAEDNNGLPGSYTTSIDLDTSGAAALQPQSLANYAKTGDQTITAGKTYYIKDGSQYSAVAEGDLDADNLGSYYEKDVWVDKEGKIISGTVVTFSFWLKASEDMDDVDITTTFANRATAAVDADLKQTFYAGTGLPNNKTKGDMYVVDAVYALRMNVSQQAYSITGATADSYALTADTTFVGDKIYYTKVNDEYVAAAVTAGESVTANTYYERTAGNQGTATKVGDPVLTTAGAVENHNATVGEDYASPTVTGTSTAIFDSPTGDANKYYKAVMKTSGYGTAGYGTSGEPGYVAGTDGTSPSINTTWETLDLEKDRDYLITINIWLEGTDAQCWDSCVGQGFTLNLKFKKAGTN